MESFFITNTQDKTTTLFPNSDLGCLYVHFQNIVLLRWAVNDKAYEFSNSGPFFFFPLFSSNKFCIVWFAHPLHAHPGNLVIYNVDSSIHKIVSAPAFINEKLLADKYADTTKLGSFQNVGEFEVVDNEEYLAVQIGTDSFSPQYGPCMHVEVRALNVESGMFHPTWSKVQYW
jgi:hypothetical protein